MLAADIPVVLNVITRVSYDLFRVLTAANMRKTTFLAIFSNFKFFKFFYILNIVSRHQLKAFATNRKSKKNYFAFWRPPIYEIIHFWQFFQFEFQNGPIRKLRSQEVKKSKFWSWGQVLQDVSFIHEIISNSSQFQMQFKYYFPSSFSFNGGPREFYLFFLDHFIIRN